MVASPGSGRKVLLLSDAFSSGSWTSGEFTPVDETAPVNAMAMSVGCYDSRKAPLEYRFARVTGRISIQVAQAMTSKNPDLELEYSLTADGRQLEAKNITFKGKAELSTDLGGVTVLRIAVRTIQGSSKDCNAGDAIALITSVVVEQ